MTSVVNLFPFPDDCTTALFTLTQISDPNVVPCDFITPVTIQSMSPREKVSPGSSRGLPASAPRVPAAPSPSTAWRYVLPPGPCSTPFSLNQCPPGNSSM